MQYQCLIHGAKGIIWWPWSVPYYNHEDEFRRLAGEIDALRPMLTGGEYVTSKYPQVQHDIHYQFWKQGELAYCLSVNVKRQARRLSVQLPEALQPRGEIQVMFEDRSLTAIDGAMYDQFAPIAVHIYRWEMQP